MPTFNRFRSAEFFAPVASFHGIACVLAAGALLAACSPGGESGPGLAAAPESARGQTETIETDDGAAVRFTDPRGWYVMTLPAGAEVVSNPGLASFEFERAGQAHFCNVISSAALTPRISLMELQDAADYALNPEGPGVAALVGNLSDLDHQTVQLGDTGLIMDTLSGGDGTGDVYTFASIETPAADLLVSCVGDTAEANRAVISEGFRLGAPAAEPVAAP